MGWPAHSFQNELLEKRDPPASPRGSTLPQPLFTTRLRRSLAREYDVTPDGQRFLVAVAPSDDAMPSLTLVQNWTGLLKR